jgi:hypothetical protein
MTHEEVEKINHDDFIKYSFTLVEFGREKGTNTVVKYWKMSHGGN